MFATILESCATKDHQLAYFSKIREMRAELIQIEGYIDLNIYRSLIRPDWSLLLSCWRDEKALVRWRTQCVHFEIQAIGRNVLFDDYHVRVGQYTRDTRPPNGYAVIDQRADETQTGKGTTLTLAYAIRPAEWSETNTPQIAAEWLGIQPDAAGLVEWDIFESVDTHGQLLLMMLWADEADARKYEKVARFPDHSRISRIRVVRDYSMRDRRESAQYYPPKTSS